MRWKPQSPNQHPSTRRAGNSPRPSIRSSASEPPQKLLQTMASACFPPIPHSRKMFEVCYEIHILVCELGGESVTWLGPSPTSVKFLLPSSSSASCNSELFCRAIVRVFRLQDSSIVETLASNLEESSSFIFNISNTLFKVRSFTALTLSLPSNSAFNFSQASLEVVVQYQIPAHSISFELLVSLQFDGVNVVISPLNIGGPELTPLAVAAMVICLASDVFLLHRSH
ncbi:uncharacterized protein G2W53_021758 [Senna tora]|uniref:Uncharacterized protein n=1 Tax=Senna tora TaxID=362788 RepID=A0A834TLW1_9FABA|nr:uncharacterized protein G2W53_021758 [Senna tora]